MIGFTDYCIIQRDEDGFGRGLLTGKCDREGDFSVAARVMREDDNMTVVDWTECEVRGKEFSVSLTLPQGGLYRVEAYSGPGKFVSRNSRYDWGRMEVCFRHVGVGDIFVLAGQSNMSAYGRDFAYDPPELGVHLFDNAGHWTVASHPLNSLPDPVYRNNDENSGTSPGLAFGRMMRRHLNIPVGLIAAAKGGSSLEDWNPAETEECFLYEAMADKIEKAGGAKAILWYQGCNETCNAHEASTYLEKLKQTIGLWREKFGPLPVVLCQINRHAWKQEDRDRFWGMVREAQRRAAEEIDGVYLVPTLDMMTTDGIHNSSGACVIIGERMANVLLHGVYGRPGRFAPRLKKITKISEKELLLTFRDGVTVRTMDDLAHGMNAEDENGLMDCVSVRQTEMGLVVTTEREIGENAVFHAYWQREVPPFPVRDVYGMPMPACYGVKIENE